MRNRKTLKAISNELNMSEADVFSKVMDLNMRYKLDIDKMDDLEDWQYQLIRAVLSEKHLVRLHRKDTGFDTLNNYRTNPHYVTVCDFAEQKDFNGKGTKEIMDYISYEIGATVRGTQMVAFAMREAGYENKIIYEGTKQRRAWFKKGYVSEDRTNTKNAVEYYLKWNNVNDGFTMSYILSATNLSVKPQVLGSILREIGYDSRPMRDEATGEMVRGWYHVGRIDAAKTNAKEVLSNLDINGLTMDEIKELSGLTLRSQDIGAVLKELGCECRITRVNSSQRRRWYKPEQPSFF
ncbi:hypothetical protein [Vibrio phage MZH0603]|nr:hypothetical protein [Vibrio phage MZH0603]